MVEPIYDPVTPYGHKSSPVKFLHAATYNNMVTEQVKSQVRIMKQF